MRAAITPPDLHDSIRQEFLMSDRTNNLDTGRLPALTGKIVAAYVAHNKLGPEGLPALIVQVHQALSTAGSPPIGPIEEKQQPAVPVRKSVMPDHIICLEDGRKFKTLRRHLQTVYGMTPQQYRQKWGLPSDYPMVAPAYASRRSELARQIGFGRKPGDGPAVTKLPPRRAKGLKG
jgi:predicted transcriptional regulator